MINFVPEAAPLLRRWLLGLLSDSSELEELATLLPEVAAMRGVPQRADFHAEGCVLTHTRLALQALAESADERAIWAVLLHDIGKVATTLWQNDTWRSPGHAEAGAELVPSILRRLGRADLIDDVVWLVRHHQFFLSWQNLDRGLSRRQLRFCRNPLFPLLIEVCRADGAGSLGSAKGAMLERVLALLAAEASTATGPE